jgi:SHC-transforming protein 1
VCEAAGLKTADKRRKAEKRVQRAIAERPIMEHAGANVNLTISSCGLVLTALESGRIVARHDMPRISFASGGDTVSTIILCCFTKVEYSTHDVHRYLMQRCSINSCHGGFRVADFGAVNTSFKS